MVPPLFCQGRGGWEAFFACTSKRCEYCSFFFVLLLLVWHPLCNALRCARVERFRAKLRGPPPARKVYRTVPPCACCPWPPAPLVPSLSIAINPTVSFFRRVLSSVPLQKKEEEARNGKLTPHGPVEEEWSVGGERVERLCARL